MKCPECGKNFPQDNKFCPGCGKKVSDFICDAVNQSKNKKGVYLTKEEEKRKAELLKKGTPTWQMILLLIIFVGGFYATFIYDSPSDKKPVSVQKPKRPEMNAFVRYYQGMIEVTNRNNYDWTPKETWEGKAIKLEINDKFTYYYRGKMKAGQTYKIPILSFSKKDGTRFNILIYKLKVILITGSEGIEILNWN